MFPIFVMCTQLVLIGWKKMARRQEIYVLLLIWEYEIYLFDVEKPLLYAVFRVWKRWESVSCWKAGSSVAHCETCFVERKWKKEWFLKKATWGTKWTRNCVVPLRISNNRRQTKFKNCLIFFNARRIWSRFVLPYHPTLPTKRTFAGPPFCNNASFVFCK